MSDLTRLRNEWAEQAQELARLGRLYQSLAEEPERQEAVGHELEAAATALRPLTRRLLEVQRRKERAAAVSGVVLSLAGIAQFYLGLQAQDWGVAVVGLLLTAVALPTTLRILRSINRRRRGAAQETDRESPQAPSNSS